MKHSERVPYQFLQTVSRWNPVNPVWHMFWVRSQSMRDSQPSTQTFHCVYELAISIHHVTHSRGTKTHLSRFSFKSLSIDFRSCPFFFSILSLPPGTLSTLIYNIFPLFNIWKTFFLAMHLQPADSDEYSPIFHNYTDVVSRTKCQCVCQRYFGLNFLPQQEEVRTRPSSLIVMIVTVRRIIASFNQARTLWLWTADIYSWCFTEMDTDVVIKCGKRFTDVQTVRGTKSFLVWTANYFSKHMWRRERTSWTLLLS